MLQVTAGRRNAPGALSGERVRHLTLVEHQTLPGVPLSPEERDTLRRVAPSVAVTPAPGCEGAFDLTPGSWVGAINLGRLTIEIRPKLPIGQLLFLLSYAVDPRRWEEIPFDFAPGATLLEATVPAFLAQVRRAVRGGLLHGYRALETALPGIRGRVRVEAQVRRHYGLFPPVEVRYDEFTADVEENRLIKAALLRLGLLPWRSAALRGALRATTALFAEVPHVHYHPAAPPSVRYGPLNRRYRPAVELARLILRATAFDLRHGRVVASTFLVDMNGAFEDFVVVALREALGLTAQAFPQGAAGKELLLDRAGAVHLRPDLSWWDGDSCTFVGDVKYKRTRAPGIEHPDLYQLLAYTVATGVPGGLLVYAAGEAEPVSHEVAPGGAGAGGQRVDGARDAGAIDRAVRQGPVGGASTPWEKQLQVTALDLAGSPEQILRQVRTVAQRVRRLRHLALSGPTSDQVSGTSPPG